MLYPVIDAETTSLDADRGNLLEVACILYDSESRTIVDRFEHVIYYLDSHILMMKERAAPFVRNMHEDNGLWEALPSGEHLAFVDAELATTLSEWKRRLGQNEMHLVGNSCRLDLNFIERHLPLTYSELHYRSIDLSGIWLASKAAHNEYVFDKDPSSHRAMDDAQQALRQFQMTLERMAAR